MLSFLNIFWFVIHNALIAFNMFGWIPGRTRRWHLAAIGLTLFSWLVMGAWKGWGYCWCADMHFAVRRELGIHRGESSYTELLLNQIPGVTVSRNFADVLTVSVLIGILICTAAVWWRDRRIAGRSEGPHMPQ